jgi:hypothetical protein
MTIRLVSGGSVENTSARRNLCRKIAVHLLEMMSRGILPQFHQQAH